jgi:hypothetical protein
MWGEAFPAKPFGDLPVSSPWIEGIPARAEPAAPRIDVLTPTFHYPTFATLLSSTVWVRMKHYDTDAKIAFPCKGDRTCKSCLAGMITYRTGWLACCSHQTYRPVIVQLSDLALEDLYKYGQSAPLIRGLKLKTTRADHRSNAKMHAVVLGVDTREHLPVPFDPRPTLVAMWGSAETQHIQGEQLDQGHGKRHRSRNGRRN